MQVQFAQQIDSLKVRTKKVLLACSGGLDSMVLLDLCLRDNLDVTVAHCNFQLRGNASDADADFVKATCDTKDITCHIKSFDTKNIKAKGESTQMVARRIRYQWFDELLQEQGYDVLMTAHHEDDNLETFFINLSRGAGLKGLTGIPVKNGKVIRPLITLSRKRILEYAQSNNIAWREDESNASDDYLRNTIRHKLAPLLQDIFPNFSKGLTTSMRNLHDAQKLTDKTTNQLKKEAMTIDGDMHVIDGDKLELKAEIYNLLSPYGFTDWDVIYKIMKMNTGSVVRSKTHQLLKDRRKLIITPLKNVNYSEIIEIHKNQNTVQWDGGTLTLENTSKPDAFTRDDSTIYIDAKLIEWPIKLRNWQQGDRCYPIGMQGSKKLSDYFTDKKLSLLEKLKIKVLTSNQDIVWIVGMRGDDRFKITTQTTQTLKINLTP